MVVFDQVKTINFPHQWTTPLAPLFLLPTASSVCSSPVSGQRHWIFSVYHRPPPSPTKGASVPRGPSVCQLISQLSCARCVTLQRAPLFRRAIHTTRHEFHDHVSILPGFPSLSIPQSGLEYMYLESFCASLPIVRRALTMPGAHRHEALMHGVLRLSLLWRTPHLVTPDPLTSLT